MEFAQDLALSASRLPFPVRVRGRVSVGGRKEVQKWGEDWAHEKQYARTISSVSSVVSALVKSTPTLRWLSGIVSAPELDAVLGDVPPAETAERGAMKMQRRVGWRDDCDQDTRCTGR